MNKLRLIDDDDDDDDDDDENQNMRLAHFVRIGIRPILAFQRTGFECPRNRWGDTSIQILELVIGISRGNSEAQFLVV